MSGIMKKKILVVDDNRVMLNFLVNTLEKKGHQVVSAQDGFTALNILSSFTPDIIFVDLIMPKISGDKLCQIIRKMRNLDDCYLVVVSAAVAEMELDYQQIGVDACIVKGPFGKMGEYVLNVLKDADSPKERGKKKQIAGIEDIYVRQVTKELLFRNSHLETILESIAEGIIEVFNKKIVYANSSAISFFARPQEKLLASYFIDLFDATLQPRVQQLFRSGTGIPSEIGIKEPLEINDRIVTIKSLPVKDDPSTNIILITDVTKRSRLEMQLRHVMKMEAIGTLASGVAHNFRNTLAGILTNNQIIQMSYRDSQELQAISKRINTSVKNGAQMVERLMQFSRKQTKKEFHKINLSVVIQELGQLISKSFDKAIDISIDIPESLFIMGDNSGLSLVLMNLSTNARDAMPKGGKLRIEARQKGNTAEVTISDSGWGMDKDTIKKCFDPFFTTKEVGKGTGLGLSTTYGIIKSHGGQISIDSVLNKGTSLKLAFPMAIPGEPDEKEYVADIVQGKGEKILVVDDEIEILKAMPDLLENLGYKASITSSGKEAIDIYKTWQPDVILMDLCMPVMNGVTCLEEILAYDPNAKIIMISGYEAQHAVGLDEHKKKLIKGYLTKPFDIYDLSVLLARVISRLD